jgi:hypothetical protein
LAIAGEVMFDDEGAAKAERLGLDVVFNEVAESLCAVEFRTAAPRRGAAEEAKLHAQASLQCAICERHYAPADDVPNTVF